ncbi:16S rRNA (cytosine(1402)-N(4))-methyltransferase RsmH [Avrilella dinanensis]|uniref:Ribosomal RNA small subunit methyltransferase H n=1 Tax=Avrilella dinanensis TaxID=2008672 RepID=A0A2M9R621_9FLAO|nr:16S rRNA (cytosine(1402)-N(4))-methyltransferase RsmH [Avrilella dinanensis]PJR04294.1 16S rRNA (cytosine(1402)-N(4))-methyltransferase [Avrilella dinanensis]
MTTTNYHQPVLLKESVDGMNIRPDGIYVDVTFGGGGHSREILSRLNEKGKLFAFDQDEDAKQNVIDDKRFTLIDQNFRYLKRYLRFYGVKQVDGILADLGVSSHQFDVPERGFSTRFDAELDMRMNQSAGLSARNVINDYAEQDLARLFKMYGELHQAKGMASAIVNYRTQSPITDSSQLKEALDKFLPAHKNHKILAQIYQAIRIEVNQEIEALKEFLSQTPEVLKLSGRLSVISYHSLEDRLVKRFMRNGMFEGEPERDMFGRFEVPFKKIGKHIEPTSEEIATNNRARSAKLRIAEKK